MKKILCISLAAILLSCSNDDRTNVPEKPVDITVIADKDNELYQIDIFKAANNVETTNLTQTLGAPYDYDKLIVDGNLLTFFDKVPKGFSVWQKNLQTQETLVTEEVCNAAGDKNVETAANFQDKLAIFAVQFNDVEPLIVNNVHVYDPQSETCEAIPVSTELVSGFSLAYVNDETILAYYEDNMGNNRTIARVNPNTLLVEGELSFDSWFTATLNGDELYLFFTDETYTVYNANNLNELRNGVLNSWIYSGFSVFDKTQFSGDTMLFDLPYIQPSPIAEGPAVVDLNTADIIEGEDSFLFEVRQKAFEEIEDVGSASFSTYAVDLKQGLVICGYNNDGSRGGIIYTNFEAEILGHVALDFIPDRIVIR